MKNKLERLLGAVVRAEDEVLVELKRLYPLGSLVQVILSVDQYCPSEATVWGHGGGRFGRVLVKLTRSPKQMVRDVSYTQIDRISRDPRRREDGGGGVNLLTKRQREVLLMMDEDEDCDIAYERGTAFVGNTPIAARTVFALIRHCAISLDEDSRVGRFERYRINGTGRWLCRDRP